MTGSAEPYNKYFWSAGQYSVFRIVFGAWLAVHFLCLLVSEHPALLIEAMLSGGSFISPGAAGPVVAVAGFLSSVLFIVRRGGRPFVLLLGYLYLFSLDRGTIVTSPSVLLAGLLLIFDIFIPARDGDMPHPVYYLIRTILTMAYAAGLIADLPLVSGSFSGPADPGAAIVSGSAATAGEVSAQYPFIFLSFAVRALFVMFSFVPGADRLVWLLVAGVHFPACLVSSSLDFSAPLFLMHILAFSNSWIGPHRSAAGSVVFFDGLCGVCHRVVKFILEEDRAAGFRFSPLGGDYIRQKLSAEEIAALPDSIVVADAAGRIMIKDRAVIFILRGLGGIWTAAGTAAEWLRLPGLTFFYDCVAAVRRRLVKTPETSCPVVSADLRSRFFD